MNRLVMCIISVICAAASLAFCIISVMQGQWFLFVMEIIWIIIMAFDAVFNFKNWRTDRNGK